MERSQAKLVAAAAGSTTTALTMTPFDVIKTRMQTQPSQALKQPLFPRPPPNTCCQPTLGPQGCVRNMASLARSLEAKGLVCVWERGVMRTEQVNGFLDAVRHVWRAEGVRGLWKGAGTTLVIGVPSQTCYMLTYDYLLNVVLPPLLPSQSFVPLTAGILARTAITTAISPLELFRTNLQSTPMSSSNPHTIRSVLTSVLALVRSQGSSSLWRGLSPTLWRDVPFSGIYWASFENLKRNIGQRGYSGTSVTFISGALSGTAAALLTSPFDVLKTRRQALLMSAYSSRTPHTIPLIIHITRTEGVATLFTGILPRISKIAPACGIMIACFEGIGNYLAKKD